MGEIRKVRVGDIGHEKLSTYIDEVYNNVKPKHKNKFNEVEYNEYFHEYDWEPLELSILEEGYDIKKYKPITVNTDNDKSEYNIIDGQHRVFILHKLFKPYSNPINYES